MKNNIYITGHKNPDSDSICAAVAYAELKHKLGIKNVIAIRQGKVSSETQYILDYFNIEAPILMTTVKSQVSDLNIDTVVPVSSDVTIKTAWEIIKTNGNTSLPVVDENDCLIGVTSLSNLTSNYMDIWDNQIFSKSNTKLRHIIETLSAKPVYIKDVEDTFSGKVVIAAMKPESAKKLIEEHDIVICGDREDAQAIILDSKASLVIVTGNHDVSIDIIDKAKEASCSIVITPYDTYTTSRLITQSMPVSYVMTKGSLISFNTNDFIDDVQEAMIENKFRSYPVVDEDNKILGTISRYHLLSKNKKKVILVDHNERSQTIDGIEDAEILEIIDHHRVATVETSNPIYFRNETLGSTSTIIGSMFFENGIRPSKDIAGILCGAIISDTLMLKSPTATTIDGLILSRLADIASIEPESFARELFKAGSSLEGKSADDIFHTDFKNFNLNSLKIGISQINTLDVDSVKAKKTEFLDLMNSKIKSSNYDLLLFLTTDILEGSSEIFATGARTDLVSKAFGVTLKDNTAYLSGVVSRKKQVVPPLTAAAEM
ncbi:MAG: putative manganese-dependent inorganic diphosphatase [Clostridium sp.]